MADPTKCIICKGTVDSASFCSACGYNFCDSCWPKQPPHWPESIPDVPHERSDPGITKRLQEILTPAIDIDTQKHLHWEDFETTWLRYFREPLQEPELQEDARYKKLMQDSFTSEWTERWPQLVSFIGQTGDGKSTIIKMLIELKKRGAGISSEDYPTPVVGGIGTSIPTSADIHLYADPESQYTQFPLIYADCEGLRGGEKIPMAHRAMEVFSSRTDTKKKFETSSNDEYTRRFWERLQGAKRRKLVFAKTEETRKREYTVREFYPRLLYTFSHVVVFVLHNERTFENGFVDLLHWAATSIESATNQSVLPHAIVVLNKSHSRLDDKEFDVQVATQKLLSDADQSLTVNSDVARLVRSWQGQDSGRIINKAEDLLKCYYSSLEVIRVPDKGRYTLMNKQIKRLQERIMFCCQGSHEGKLQARRDLNADELGECLQSGLDHFSSTLTIPFDFLAFSWSRNPIPSGFEGGILRLAFQIKKYHTHYAGNDVFKHLSHMVASCIMLDFVRHRVKGTPLELLDHYKPVFNGALDKCCNFWWPCNYLGKNGKKCINTREGHVKGHQDERGKLIGNGEYQSDFSAESYRPEWNSHLQRTLLDIETRMKRNYLTKLEHHHTREQDEAKRLHLCKTKEFYQNLGGAGKFHSNLSCFSCLRDMPEHPLPCGHVICSPCVRNFGSQISKTAFSLEFCPLHQTDYVWGDRVQISLKPHLAGVRVLSLDGGGIRGIVELQVLYGIEKELGGNIPIQDFFDLIVGTSTGGIIALGLGVQNWPVRDCMEKFKKLCGDAFSEREFSHVPLLEQMATANHKSKYKTQPFERALESVFGRHLLFGGISRPKHYTRNVAVTTTTGIGTEPRILANYNRPRKENPEYAFDRPEDEATELKTWQAARATSAAPPYFKSFCPNESDREYIDGAVYHNNPIKVADAERKYLWPDVETLDPDILLSLGTGKSSSRLAQDAATLDRHSKSSKWFTWVPKVFRILFNRMDDILDSERAWEKFGHNVPQHGSSKRYFRINPELSTKPPALDEKDKVESLEADVIGILDFMNNEIRAVADRLLASCFYFEKANVQPTDGQIIGQICCRFENETPNLRHLGTYLRTFQKLRFAPRFSVTEEDIIILIIPITDMTIDGMVNFATFSMDEPTIIQVSSKTAKTTISLVLRHAANHAQVSLTGLPISGFPRQLRKEDENTASRQKLEREAIQRSQLYHLNLPIRNRDSYASLRISPSRHSSPRDSEDVPRRSDSIPTSGIASQINKDYPNSPNTIPEWQIAQSESAMAELEGAPF